jgi:hypothetical protein
MRQLCGAQTANARNDDAPPVPSLKDRSQLHRVEIIEGLEGRRAGSVCRDYIIDTFAWASGYQSHSMIDGFAMPLERMKADHRAADCIVQVSPLKDQAIAEGSDQAKDCEKALDLTAAPKPGKVLSGKNVESVGADSITSQTPTAARLIASAFNAEDRAETICDQ